MVIGVGGEHDDGDAWVLGGQPAGGADAVQDRHVQVEQDRVGLVLGHELQGLLGGLAVVHPARPYGPGRR